MFVLIESVKNGSVTMSVGATALDFPTFEQAVSKIKSLLSEIDEEDIDVLTDNSEEFCYNIKQKFPVVGITRNIHMKIYTPESE